MRPAPYKSTRILVIGGTVFSERTARGIMPITDGSMLLAQYAPDLLAAYQPEVAEVTGVGRRDSTDMHFEEYRAVGREIARLARDGYRSVLVAQGTDSMSYANAFFSFRYGPAQQFNLTITGSMFPLSDGHGSDAHRNLALGLEVGRKADRWLGTYNAINNGHLLRASRSVKTTPNRVVGTPETAKVLTETKAFESVNYPVIAYLNGGEQRQVRFAGSEARKRQNRFIERQRQRIAFFKPLEEYTGGHPFFEGYRPVHLAELHPNFIPDELDDAFDKGKTIVIKATGTGGVFNTPEQVALIPRIRRHVQRGGFVAITSRVPRAIIEPTYEVNRRSMEAGAALMYDMPAEAVIAKAEFVGGLAENPDEFKQGMLYPIQAEISVGLLPRDERVSDDVMYHMLTKAARKPSPSGGAHHLNSAFAPFYYSPGAVRGF